MAVPQPRTFAGQALATGHLVHAMLDISDGLAVDLHHLTNASKTGAVLRASALPISATTREVAAVMGRDPLDLALFGGEDYELLAAVPPDRMVEARQLLGDHLIHEVGRVLQPSGGVLLEYKDGTRVPLHPGGWRHF